MDRVTKKKLVAEFGRSPFGRHSVALQEIINRFRAEPVADKYILICLTPHKKWVLGRLPPRRGGDLAVMSDFLFSSLEEAERTVFALRWDRHNGLVD